MATGRQSDKQIEAENLLRSLSDGEVPESVIDEIVSMISDNTPVLAVAEKKDTEQQIRMKLLDETDWRKRASLSAMLISKSLE